MSLQKSDAKRLKAGDAAPDFSLVGTDGRMHSLADYRGAKALAVVFTCNHCPFAQAKFGRMNQIFAKYAKLGLKMAAINPNDALSYPADSFENMQKTAREKKFEFDYLYDETQEVARAYDAACTPDFYVFDKDMRLAYRGRLDDSRPNSGTPLTGRDLRAALDAVLVGDQPVAKQYPSAGCNIKWKS